MDERYLLRAIDLAARARSKGNEPVGPKIQARLKWAGLVRVDVGRTDANLAPKEVACVAVVRGDVVDACLEVSWRPTHRTRVGLLAE
jgi:hypothetical protein